MALQMGFLCLALLGLSSALVCPNGLTCQNKNTCCKNTEGGYGCCPLPRAECCSDHLHCCYEGTLCDLVHEKCVNKTVSLPWMTRLPTQPQLEETVKAVVCPDQVSECPDDTTCCQLPDSSWGCCPLAKAVCCDDRRHCCPEATKCDIAHLRCVSASLESFPLLAKLPARRRGNNPGLTTFVASIGSSISCPDGKLSCPNAFTCCLLPSGEYGCCPYPKATCCEDHLHCCPANMECDLKHSRCRRGETVMPLMKKIPAVASDISCPDKKSFCPDHTTCCKMINDTYGCCPMPSAICCSDRIHCCPAGSECDLYHRTCVSTQRNPTMTLAEAATELLKVQRKDLSVHSIPCNDSVACADGSTCCKTLKGDWACCPLPQAVCCEDHLHCCPHGTICNLKSSTCDDSTGNAVTPMLGHVPVFPLLEDSNNRCDKSTTCPGKSTCCKTASGSWACCPLRQAVCCDDHIHCCPHSKVCNLAAETCDDPRGFSPPISWLTKVAALTLEVEDEKCDEKTRCPWGSTCCKMNSGQWACCPLPQAVCCNDHEHCCPKGYKCNVAEGTCDKPGGLSVAWLQKIPALQEELGQTVSHPTQNMCDAQTSCPRDTTCCFMEKEHKWGCCPLPNAVCCKDGNHCCPSGHTCEPHHFSCSRGSHVIPWFAKVSAVTEPGAVIDVKCDNKSSCASGTTCCKLKTGKWGCCPLFKAVCCTDHEHCCPQGYTCNMQTGTCEKKQHYHHLSTIPQIEVLQSVKEDEEDVACDGRGEFHCSKRDTCCKISATEWSCCPSPRAVCCFDSKHCCPAGYSCDLKAGGCTLQTQLTWDSWFGDRKRDTVHHGL